MSDVAVAGGGLVGLAVAWRAALRGLSVTVADDAPGAGASAAAAGMLAPVTEAGYREEPLLRLGAESLARWPAFAAELEAAAGRPVGLRTAGTLVVGFDEDDVRDGGRPSGSAPGRCSAGRRHRAAARGAGPGGLPVRRVGIRAGSRPGVPVP